MKRAIIIGGDHHNTLGVIRSLGIRGITPEVVIVSGDGNTFVGKSKYIRSLHIVRTDNEVVRYLLQHLANEDNKAAVICCSDGVASEIDLHVEHLTNYFIIPGASESGRITQLMNKKKMADLAVECGLDIPVTYSPSKFPIKTEEVCFPCIVKPIASILGKKEDICICYDISTLNQIVGNLGIENVQIQQFVDKDYEYQLIGCSLGDNVIIPGFSQILRPCKSSNTSFLHYQNFMDDSFSLEECKEYVRRTGYRGLFSLEFLRDKNGKNLFMEMNFRNDGNSYCVTASGVNLPYVWFLYCFGENYQKETSKEIVPKFVMPDSAELRLLLTKQITLFQYLNDLIKTDCFMELNRNDMRPFWKMLKMKFKYIWSKDI